VATHDTALSVAVFVVEAKRWRIRADARYAELRMDPFAKSVGERPQKVMKVMHKLFKTMTVKSNVSRAVSGDNRTVGRHAKFILTCYPPAIILIAAFGAGAKSLLQGNSCFRATKLAFYGK
jgi:hypothetical protein